MTRTLRLVAALLATLLSVMSMTAAAKPAVPTAVAETNGPLLDSSDPLALRDLEGVLVAEVEDADRASEAHFSPDGSMIAVVRQEGCEPGTPCSTHLEIISNTGTSLNTPSVSGIGGAAWSPDGSHVAIMGGGTVDDAPQDGVLYSVRSDGTDLKVLARSSSSLTLIPSAISWSPDGSRIAVLGSEPSDGGTLQVFTIPAIGGSPTRYSTPMDTDCSSTCDWYTFNYPAWSPDGTQIAVWALHQHGAPESMEFDQFLGVLREGDAVPTTIYDATPDGDDINAMYENPIWSADGTQILVRHSSDGLATYNAKLVTVSTGEVTTVPVPDYLDWQRCPSGVCASWTGDVPPLPVPSETIVTTSAKRGTLVVRGSVSPSSPGQTVTVLVKRRAKVGAPFKTVDRLTPILSAESTFRASTELPNGRTCKVVAKYAGDEDTAESQDSTPFAC